jgi:hypothetical protein
MTQGQGPTIRKDGSMRGRILQYNGNDGTGIISAEGQQYKFGLANWKGDAVPAVGKTVEFVLAEGQVQTVMLVGDDVLFREKAADLGGKLGGLVGGLASKSGEGGGGNVGANLVGFYGVPTLVAYGVFLISTMFFAAISIPLMGVFGGGGGPTLWQLSALAGGLKFLLLLSYISIGVPFFWRDKRAWLALLVPVLTMVFTLVKANGMGGLGSVAVLGFWLPAAAAGFMGFVGFKKFSSGS